MSTEKFATKQVLNLNLFPTSSKRNRYQKLFEETCVPKNNVKRRNLCKKISEEFLPKKSNNFFYQKFSRQKTLPRELWRDILCSKIWREISTKKSFKRLFPAKKSGKKQSTKNSSEEKSLPKNEETSPATKLQTIMTRNIKNIRTGEICGKNALSNFNFDSWELFLIEISFGWTCWVEMLLQILFARGFSNFGWLRSLLRYIWVEC